LHYAENAYSYLAAKPKGREVRDLCTDGKIIFKWTEKRTGSQDVNCIELT
jgi:hypothetical protein